MGYTLDAQDMLLLLMLMTVMVVYCRQQRRSHSCSLWIAMRRLCDQYQHRYGASLAH